MPDPDKKYPVKNPNERRDTKSGTIKQTNDTSGKKYYHKDPVTGKMVEYDATRYVDAYNKKNTPPPSVKPQGDSVKRFDNSKDMGSDEYMKKIFAHTTGKPDSTKKGEPVYDNKKRVFK